MKHILKIFIAVVAFVGIAHTASANLVITPGPAQPSLTTTAFLAPFRVTGSVTTSTKVNVWLKDVAETTWKTRSYVLTNFTAANGAIDTNITASIGMGTYSLASGRTYLYYLADGQGNDAFLFTNPACFNITTGPVPCPTTTGEPDATPELNIVLESLGQTPSTTTPGSFVQKFRIRSVTPLATSAPAKLRLYKVETNVTTLLREAAITIPAGNNAIEPTTNPPLVPGSYQLQVFNPEGNVLVSNTLDFTVTAVAVGGGTINYTGAPTVTCDANARTCTFKVMTKALGADTWTFNLLGFPKTIYDGGSNSYGEITSRTDIETVTANQEYEARITATFSDLGSFAGGTDDDQFYYAFNETKNDNISPISLNALDITTYGIVRSGTGATSFGAEPTGITGPEVVITPTTQEEVIDDGRGESFLKNPFKNLDSFPKIIKAVVNNIVLPVMIPFIALMLIYSGFKFVVARRNGQVDGIADAKETLKWTLIGAALVLGAFVIANALQATLNTLIS